MIRIGIIGSENSHATAFSEIFNNVGKYPDMRVVGIYGEDPAESKKIFDKCSLEFIARDARDMLGRVDAVMVTSRDGSLHARYARPFLEAGLPAFIDKPFTSDGPEAAALLDLARESGSPVMGGSSVKLTPDVQAIKARARAMREGGKLIGGHAWAPVNMVNPYGNFYFYSAHLVENALAIFGYAPARVSAIARAKGVFAVLEYEDVCVHLSFLEGNYRYGVTLLSDEVETRDISLDGCYEIEVSHFAHMLRTGQSPQTREELAAPVFVLNAIERAYATGKAQETNFS